MMKRTNILVLKEKFKAELPNSLFAKEPIEARYVAGEHVWDKYRFGGKFPVMIEDTMVVQETKKAWVVQVDYYGGK